MLRCFAEILTWIALTAVGIGIFVGGWLVRDYGISNYPEGDNVQKWLNVASVAIWILLGIYLLCVCCMYYSIKISVKVLKTSAKIITRNMRMILVPVIGICVAILWLSWCVYFLLWIMSCGEVVQKSYSITPFSAPTYYYTYEWTHEQKGYLWYSVFMFFWVSAFLMAASQYVLIVAVVSWYFTENAQTRGNFSICRGYWWTIRYNMGSLLFGALVLAIIWMIRIVFEYVQKKIEGVNGDRPLPRPV